MELALCLFLHKLKVAEKRFVCTSPAGIGALLTALLFGRWCWNCEIMRDYTNGLCTTAHPGEILKELVIDFTRINYYRCSASSYVRSRKTFVQSTERTGAVTPEMAVRLEWFLANLLPGPLRFRLQNAYDLWQARQLQIRLREYYRYNFEAAITDWILFRFRMSNGDKPCMSDPAVQRTNCKDHTS